MPYLKNIIDGATYMQLGATLKLNEKNSISIETKYFTLGDIIFTDIVGNVTGSNTTKEISQGVKFAHAFNENFSLGVGAKYFYSNIAGDQYVGGRKTRNINSFALSNLPLLENA